MTVKRINSESNATFKLLLKLAKAQAIKKYGLALMSGPKQVMEVLAEFPEQCDHIIFSDQQEHPLESNASGIPAYCLKAPLFRQIDRYHTGQPALLVRIEPLPQWDDTCKTSGCTLCLPFQDPANVGAAIRTAAALKISRVVFLKEAAHPFHHKSLRVAGSSIFRIPLFQGPSIYELRPSRTPIFTLSPQGIDVKDFNFPDSFCLVPGLEGPGLPDHLNGETCLSIPMAPGIESLNAAMATGIVLYVWKRYKEKILK